MCTPSRVQALTGQYPFRTGWIAHHDVPRWGGAGLSLDRSNATTWAKVLRDSGGYRTALAGKWQLHHLGRRPRALDEHGFDEHCVWPGNEIGAPLLTDESKYWSPVLQQNGARARHERWAPPRANATARGGDAGAAERKGYGPRIINDFVNRYVARDDARGRPFFVLYAMLLCHKPLVMPPGASGQGRGSVMHEMVR